MYEYFLLSDTALLIQGSCWCILYCLFFKNLTTLNHKIYKYNLNTRTFILKVNKRGSHMDSFWLHIKY